MSVDIIKNQSIPALTEIVDKFSFLYECVLEQSGSLHSEKETVYCLRSITSELRKHMLGEYCSQKYIDEKLHHLTFLTRDYSVRDDNTSE